MKFDYFKFPLSQKSEFFGSSLLKPIIPAVITNPHNGKSIKYAALIDSGADFCIFDAEIGDYLNIDIKSGQKEIFGGIQDRGGATAYLHKIEIEIGGWKYKATVTFSYDIAERGYGIFGQKGFFDIFSVKFDYLKEEIELKPINKF
jgi:predicted aspartyl protease